MAEAIVLDRILAVVNGEIIALSDAEGELVFFEGRAVSDSAIQEEVQKLIDQKLFLAEAKRFDVGSPSESEVQEELQRIQRRFASPDLFEKALRENAMTLEDLKHKVTEHLIVDRFIDQRIRFFVIVLPEEVSRYYDEHHSDFQNKPLENVENEIEKFLTTQKAKEKLEDYLSKVRAKANIQINS
jgi:peptidyl-prolyl cis-trans isomerase SurA